MKKIIPLIITLVLCSGTTIAQKKTTKKPTKTTKKFEVPKVKKTIEVFTPPSDVDYKYPSVSISPQESQFEKDVICSTCDTLVLEAGKPHIIVYDVKWMARRESRSFEKQPTEADLKNQYFALKDLHKREWDELHKNYSEADVNYHHIYRNTFIKIPNKQNETLSLLNREKRHEGFLYWSGNTSDAILESQRLALSTEQIAKIRGENKISSYYEAFKKDSLKIENFKKTTSATIDLQQHLNAFLLDELFDDFIFPVQFMDLKKVHKMYFESKGEKILSFTFNTNGQLTEFDKIDRGKYSINYQNNLPTTIFNNSVLYRSLYCQDDKVILTSKQSLQVFQLVGKVFFDIDRYAIDKKDYENMEIASNIVRKISNDDGNTCEIRANNEETSSQTICYSNTQWQLPLTVTNSYGRDSNSTIYKINENNELQIESENPHKSIKFLYQLENGILKQFDILGKRGEADYKVYSSISVSYDYYK
jgi:hypothetical protein